MCTDSFVDGFRKLDGLAWPIHLEGDNRKTKIGLGSLAAVMLKPLKIGITGVRGIIGETFTPELAVGFAQAFSTYLDSGRILVCSDTRASGPMVRAAVAAGLLAAGSEVIDLGVCPTPSLQLAVTWLQAQRCIASTAGH